jgi:hypothetical protein
MLPEFNAFLEKSFDAKRLRQAQEMVRNQYLLFCELTAKSIVGVMHSQTDQRIFYACQLTDTGEFSCATNDDIFPCGGLRGTLCKHLLVFLISKTQSGELDPATACTWIEASRRKSPKLDREIVREIFQRYKEQEGAIEIVVRA